MIILIVLQMTAFWKKESKNQVISAGKLGHFWKSTKNTWLTQCCDQTTAARNFFDTLLERQYQYLSFLNLATGTPVMTFWKKWPHVAHSRYQEISPVLSSSTTQHLFSNVQSIVHVFIYFLKYVYISKKSSNPRVFSKTRLTLRKVQNSTRIKKVGEKHIAS